MRMHSQRAKSAFCESQPGRLREEIETLEKRLAQIGPDGDCGYENALIRFLEQQLGERRALLRETNLRQAGAA